MIWVIVLGAALLVVYGLSRALKRPAAITAAIAISDSGQSSVEFSPLPTSGLDLVQLVMCYGVKVRWLLRTEPELVAEMFDTVVDETVRLWTEQPPLLSRSATAKQIAEAPDVDHAVPGGERFVVRFHRNSKGDGYVINHLPQPGMSINMGCHFVLLLSKVHQRLTAEERDDSTALMLAWGRRMADIREIPQTFAGLRVGVDGANLLWHSAFDDLPDRAV